MQISIIRDRHAESSTLGEIKMIEHERDIGLAQPGTHGGGGSTVGYSFFAGVADLGMVFRKRVLHPGAAIGVHRNHRDEIFYVLHGQALLELDGQQSLIGPGTAVLTRAGQTHGLQQAGAEDLVVFIAYAA